MPIKKIVEDEKAKLMTELKAIEDKAKEDLKALEAKIDVFPEFEVEIKSVAVKIEADVQKVEKWFVEKFKKQPLPSAEPVVEPVVEPTTPVAEPTDVVTTK